MPFPGLRSRDRTVLFGYGLFIALMAGGYLYMITFVQLGLLDLGRAVGLPDGGIAAAMVLLAALTTILALLTGRGMDRRGLGGDLRAKLRLLLAVAVLLAALTLAAPLVATPLQYHAWIVVAAVAFGVAFPAAASTMVDLVAVRDRGAVAAITTAVTYGIANILPFDWSLAAFAPVMAGALLLGIGGLAVLLRGFPGIVDEWADQHRRFGTGRYSRNGRMRTWSIAFFLPVVLMFGVFFIDSLGFLRIVESPGLVLAAWQSPSAAVRAAIAGAHILGALAAGVLYRNLDRRWLFLTIFGLFAFTHLLYTFDLRFAAWFPPLADGPALMDALFYAVAVSIYTTVNFALWPDLSTVETAGTRTAVGIGVAGWLPTFLSTGIALHLTASGVSTLDHLNLVNALALLLTVALAVLIYGRRLAAARGEPA